uniref:glutathione transferase n=1 Tax=Opuntia streptacantha TaxID=393608 RepID=A0A7C8Z852_OPUST
MATSEKPKLKLYSYWRSSCAWRVRIALHLKGLDYEYKAVNLLKGDHFSPEFQNLNPLGYVPVLVDEDIVIADSFAIVMYLEEKYPQHPLLPQNLQKKALNYQVANIIASSIQPLQNLSVLNYVEGKVGADERLSWAQHHIKKGFSALEKLLKGHAGKYATGDEIALADLFLAPQMGATKRFNVDLAEFPLLKRLDDAYSDIPAFMNAVPEKQPDAPDDVTSS